MINERYLRIENRIRKDILNRELRITIEVNGNCCKQFIKSMNQIEGTLSAN